MSEPMPEGEGGGGSFLTRKFAGIPAIVWLLGATLLAYLYFRNKNGGSASSSGGGGTATTGDIAISPGTTTIDVRNHYSGRMHVPASNKGTPPPRHRTPNPQPRPHTKPPIKKQATTKRTYTVRKGDTLASIAHRYGISLAQLAHANVYVAGEVPGNHKVGQHLGTGAGLKTGQRLVIP